MPSLSSLSTVSSSLPHGSSVRVPPHRCCGFGSSRSVRARTKLDLVEKRLGLKVENVAPAPAAYPAITSEVTAGHSNTFLTVTTEKGAATKEMKAPLSPMAIKGTFPNHPESESTVSITVVGTSGDLAKKKIFPALFALYYEGCLPKHFTVFGYARSKMTDEELRNMISGTLTCRIDQRENCDDKMENFLKRCFYQAGQYSSEEDFKQLDAKSKVHEGGRLANRLFYLSIPPNIFIDVARCASRSSSSAKGWTRVIVEKPFGRDSESSAELTKGLKQFLTEEQIYRIDHYLGKELVENLSVLSIACNDGSGGRLHELLHTMDSRMDQQGLTTSRLFHLLQRCIQENDKIAGKEVERYILENGLKLDALLGNSLIRMHTLFEELSQANEIFKNLLNPCVFSWNAIISAHVRFGENNQAITLYHEMCHSGVEPNGHISVTVLKACSNVSALEVGRQVHAHVIGNGFESDVFVGSTLIYMYAKCHKVDTAPVVFNKLPNRNVVTWSALIAGYLQHGQAEEALQCSKEMQQEGLQPNEVTFVSLLKACSSIAAQEQGKCIHDQIIESGLEADPFIGSTLVDMYAKCGNLEDAHTVFDRLPSKDLVAWSALIAGYAQCRQGQEALQLFREMVQKGMVPDRVTFICLLQSCSSIAALEHGKLIHMQIIDNGFESDLRIGSTLIDMYAKCGSLDDAAMVLQRLLVRNVVTWSTMIAGCALQSNYPLALQFFEAMQRVGLKPNKVTFISLLSACSHAGRVEEACLHLKSMRQDHSLEPALEHYNSMADLLGRAGYLNEAEDLMDSLPFRPDIVGWTSLLGSCSTYDNVELGRRCFDRVLDEGECATAYVLMSSIYAHVGMWADAARIRERRRCAGVWKKPAKAFIEIDNQVHSFTVGDNSHPRSDDVYAKLKSLSMHMRGKGFNKSNMEFVLGSKSDGDKRDSMCGHSEKLAIAFGLISTPQGTTIRVGKNLRVCADCHTAAKIISKVELREIIVSDSYSVHHFKDGLCCCNEH